MIAALDNRTPDKTAGTGAQFPARPRLDLDAMFRPRSEGYLGADVGLSIPLPDGRVAWFFGDTLVGKKSGERRDMTAMPRNSVAIVERADGAEPKVTFHWGERDGTPQEFLQLPVGDVDEWFWPATGWHTRDAIHVVGYGARAGVGSCEAMSFAIEGMWKATMSNLAGPPETWHVEMSRWLPQATAADVYLCSAHFIDGDVLWLFGYQRGGADNMERRGVLARMPVHDSAVAAPESLEYWSEDSVGGTALWTKTPQNLRTIVPQQVTEATVIHDRPRRRYLMTSYPGDRADLALRTAPELTGPWSDPIVIFGDMPFADPDCYIQYALRLHPHLARSDDELILSYLVNARSTRDLFATSDIYYPRFISLEASTL